MRLGPSVFTLVAIASLLANPVAADDDRCRGPVSAQEAIRIARTVGLVHVEKVECDDGKWEVEGRDARGREIEVEVHARTGRILDVDRDD